MSLYATLADLQGYLGAPPVSGDDRRLQRASDLLDAALIATKYDVDGFGAPTAADDIAALREACCAQVESWHATGNEGGDAEQWQEMSLGPAKLVRRGAVGGETAGAGIAADRLCPRALEYLRRAALWPGRPTLR